MRELEEVVEALKALERGEFTRKHRRVLVRAGCLYRDRDFGLGIRINPTQLGKTVGIHPSGVEKWLKNRAAAATEERGTFFLAPWMRPPGENGTMTRYAVTTREFKEQKKRRKSSH